MCGSHANDWWTTYPAFAVRLARIKKLAEQIRKLVRAYPSLLSQVDGDATAQPNGKPDQQMVWRTQHQPSNWQATTQDHYAAEGGSDMYGRVALITAANRHNGERCGYAGRAAHEKGSVVTLANTSISHCAPLGEIGAQ